MLPITDAVSEEHSAITGWISKDPDDSKAEQSDPARQSVESVGQIDGIGDADERKNSYWNRDIVRQGLKPKKREVSDHHPAIQNDGKDGDDLAQKLESEIESLDVIPGPEKQDDHNAAQESHHLRVHRSPHERWQDGADDHRQSTESRNRRLVDLAGGGHIDDMPPIRQADER